MSDLVYPDDLKYTAEHEWVRADGDTLRVGITDFAQDALGDIVYVSLPAVGDTVVAGDTCGEVESTKSVSDVYAPVVRRGRGRNERPRRHPRAGQHRPLRRGLAVRARARRRGGARRPDGRRRRTPRSSPDILGRQTTREGSANDGAVI